ncbi:unnamed protein product [Ectocarpus sp. CCAP 1310/34]|nr:unnamed protein product [Ectocarpus sp. CCAP 1310/34]
MAELVGNDDDHRHHGPDPEGYEEPEPEGYGGYGVAGGGGGGGRAADAEAEDAEDVQARVAAYTRLAGKKQPQTTAHVPSLPKPMAQKSKKRASATNIADFYGGGESDDEEKEGFGMDPYNKGVLSGQFPEAGTHTEDGQLRPQASSERDQQKLAHLVRVGKLGAALRGKGGTSGKRR